jgi:opacity protein-like surface antigen
MRVYMKRFILSFIACLSFCVYAGAYEGAWDDCCCENDTPFYAEVFGGANFLQTEKRHGVKSDFDTGYIVSGSLGYRWCYGFRLEAEYAYRRNTFRKLHFYGEDFRTHGHFQSSSYMGNLIWDLPLSDWGCGCWDLQPFIGGGVGYDYQLVRAHEDDFNVKLRKKHFSWQVIAGIFYPIFCNTNISVEYKYHQGGFRHLYCHSVGVGLTYNFGL